jgi:hypothetical protein
MICTTHRNVRFAMTAIGLLAAACAPRANPSPPVPAEEPASASPTATVCSPFDTVGHGGDTIDVTIAGDLDPSRIGRPRHAAERMLFERVYQPLIGVACDGSIQPAAAETWSYGGGSWTFRIARGARFGDGMPLRARDVIESWATSRDSLAAAIAARARTAGDTLVVIDADGDDERLFASRALSIARERQGSVWPEGTGTHAFAGGSNIVVTSLRDSLPSYRVHTGSSAAARNRVDAGTHVLITGDSATAAYGERRAAMVVTPLAWDRTWFLLVAGAEPATPAAAERVQNDLAAMLRTDARGAEPRGRAAAGAECPASAPAPGAASRVAFQADDPTARLIAERLVALTGSAGAGGDSAILAVLNLASDQPRRIIAQGMSRAAYEAALQNGTEGILVASAQHDALPRCEGWRVVPLVDTRWRIAIRASGSGNER